MAILDGGGDGVARQRRRVQRRDLFAARHLRLPARPDAGHLRERGIQRRRRRFRRGDGAPEGTGARRQVPMAANPTTTVRPPTSTATTRSSTGPTCWRCTDGVAVNRLNEGGRRRSRRHAVLRRIRRPGRRSRRPLQSAHGIFAVEDTQKIQAAVFGHHGVVKTGSVSVGNGVMARHVDVLARQRTMRNHSATHLLHKALREVLGDHVQQKGSQVDPDKTRFDFVHNQPMTNAEIRRVENLVNAEILANTANDCRVLPIAEAQKLGAMMLFGEKYGDSVRVLDIGSSRELCGGTHVARTGDIGLFSIVAEGGVAPASGASRR